MMSAKCHTVCTFRGSVLKNGRLRRRIFNVVLEKYAYIMVGYALVDQGRDL